MISEKLEHQAWRVNIKYKFELKKVNLNNPDPDVKIGYDLKHAT